MMIRQTIYFAVTHLGPPGPALQYTKSRRRGHHAIIKPNVDVLFNWFAGNKAQWNLNKKTIIFIQ